MLDKNKYKKCCGLICSVADPGCLSRIPDPDFYPSWIRISDPGSQIPDPKTATKERGDKNERSVTYVLVIRSRLKGIIIQ
jgi:hypothetical protein